MRGWPVRSAAWRACVSLAGVAWPTLLWAQSGGHSGHLAVPEIQSNFLLNVSEAITGFAAALMAFQAARAYRAGQLARGMIWVTVGMVVMAIGHLVLVVRRLVGVDPLSFLGDTGSFVAFSIAVFASFVASGYGFWLIRRTAPRATLPPRSRTEERDTEIIARGTPSRSGSG